MNSYTKILQDIPDNKKQIAKKLVDDILYIELKMDEYKEIIDRDGVITTMEQGSYCIERENPAVRGFHAMVKSRDTILKQLNALIDDKEGVTKAGAALEKFIAAGKK